MSTGEEKNLKEQLVDVAGCVCAKAGAELQKALQASGTDQHRSLVLVTVVTVPVISGQIKVDKELFS